MSGRDEGELADLLRAGLAGDERAYARFLHRAAGLVRTYVRRRITHGGVDAEDVVQETLLALHLKRHTWMADAPVLPWMFAIARFKLIDAFRRRGRRIEVDLDEVAETLAQPEEDQASARDVTRALDTLAPGQKAVVSAISVEGHSIAQTAQALGMNEAAVRVALHRGLAALARRFGRT